MMHKFQLAGAFAVMFLGASISHAAPAINPAACRNLVAATPSADVAYQPGVDASGHAVAPADLPGSGGIQVPQRIDIPLTFSLASQLHLPVNQPPVSTLGAGSEGWIGTLSVEGNRSYFNGQPLSDAQQENLAVLCMQQTR